MVGELVETDAVTETKTYLWGQDVTGTEQGAGCVGGLLTISTSGGAFAPV